MTDTNTPVAGGTLIDVKDTVAQNIAKAIGLAGTEAEVAAIKQHVEDELSAIHTHFVITLQDVQHAYEMALVDVKSAYSFADAHRVSLSIVGTLVFVLGAIFGHFV